jgi:hypothetical protein
MNSPTDLEVIQRLNPKLTYAQAREAQERGVAYVRYLRQQRDGLRNRNRNQRKQIENLEMEMYKRDQEWRAAYAAWLTRVRYLEGQLAVAKAALEAGKEAQ